MPKEQPVNFGRSKGKALKPRSKYRHPSSEEKLTCIIHFDRNTSDTEVKPLSEYTFSKIENAATFRQNESNPDIRLDDITTNIPKTLNISIHESHRWCYQNFTNVYRLKRKQTSSTPDNQDNEDASTSKRVKRASGRVDSPSILFPADKCLFCSKTYIKVRTARQSLVKCVAKTAAESIKSAAEDKNDEAMLCRIRNIDLVAREARYHNHCRQNYTRKDTRHLKSDDPEISAMYAAHKDAFEHVCAYVEENIIRYLKVERMTMLREKYLLYMLENHPEAYNKNYKTDKLKNRLKNHFGRKIKFWQPSHLSELVYSDYIHTGQAVEVAFELASSDERRMEEASMIIRRDIMEAQRTAETMPWPPTASWLMSKASRQPQLLLHFLSNVVAAKQYTFLSPKSARLVESTAQDICYATTNGQWAMPKHILLAMTIRHLTGSAEIITILNRFGHCCSYSKTLELETAICNSITSSESVIPPSISTDNNSVIHLCWDNFDLNEETPSGSGTTHTAHGIIIQEREHCSSENASTEPEIRRSHERTVRPKIKELKPCFLKAKAEPVVDVKETSPSKTTHDFSNIDFSDFFWIYCRILGSYQTQSIPSWNGWLATTAPEAEQAECSVVDYMAPVMFPITDNATVQHVLEVSQAATQRTGQDITIVTFDLAVVKKAYSILWQNQQEFSDVLVRLRVFHSICSLLSVVGKRMAGSGLSDILIESGVCASGSLGMVMSGKHYNRAIRVHKLVLEALERLLFDVFEVTENVHLDEETRAAIMSFMQQPNADSLRKLMTDEKCQTLLQKYHTFKDTVRHGSLGKTAEFWLSYMDTIWCLLKCIRATKENNLDLHIASLHEQCPLYFAYDHPNYARYMSLYLLTLMNLSQTHAGAEQLLRRNGFSVSRSTVPASRTAVDITIEQTINRHAKSHGGIVGFSRNQLIIDGV